MQLTTESCSADDELGSVRATVEDQVSISKEKEQLTRDSRCNSFDILQSAEP